LGRGAKSKRSRSEATVVHGMCRRAPHQGRGRSSRAGGRSSPLVRDARRAPSESSQSSIRAGRADDRRTARVGAGMSSRHMEPAVARAVDDHLPVQADRPRKGRWEPRSPPSPSTLRGQRARRPRRIGPRPPRPPLGRAHPREPLEPG
jgi:hypothetical protein